MVSGGDDRWLVVSEEFAVQLHMKTVVAEQFSVKFHLKMVISEQLSAKLNLKMVRSEQCFLSYRFVSRCL